MSHPSGVRDEKLERILKNPPKVTDGEVIVHKTKEPFGHKPLVELGGVAQAEPQTLADLCARYELEMNPDSVPADPALRSALPPDEPI